MNLDEIINQIEMVSKEIMTVNCDYRKSVSELLSNIINMLPRIISIYSEEKMHDIKERVMIWPKSVEDFVVAYEKNDEIEILDSLVNVILIDFVELKAELMQRGLYSNEK